MLSTVILWLFFLNNVQYSQSISPRLFFCNWILLRFIDISKHTGIAILIPNPVVINFVFVSGRNVKSLSLRNFSLNFCGLANENKIRCQVIATMSNLKLYNGYV